MSETNVLCEICEQFWPKYRKLSETVTDSRERQKRLPLSSLSQLVRSFSVPYIGSVGSLVKDGMIYTTRKSNKFLYNCP